MFEVPVEYLKLGVRTVGEHGYHGLVFLVSDFASSRAQLMRCVCREVGGVYLNVNLELTRQLLTIDAHTYTTRASPILQHVCDVHELDWPLFPDNVELLLPSEAGGLSPEVAVRDLFASAVRKFSVERLRSVCLSHMINGILILQTVTGRMARCCDPGDGIRSTDSLHRIYEEYGQWGVVTNCVCYFLRALSWFGCLERLAPNHYRFGVRLPVAKEVFPLLVYSCL